MLRANFGVSTTFGTGNGGFFDDWKLNFDYIFSRFRNPADFVDLSQVIDITKGNNGFTVDGRPIYAAIDPNNAGCNATLIGTGGLSPTYSNVTSDCFVTSRDDEIQLTNGKAFNSHVASVRLGKYWNGGLLTDNGSVSFNLGYAYTNAKNTGIMPVDGTSSSILSHRPPSDNAGHFRYNPAKSLRMNPGRIPGLAPVGLLVAVGHR